MKTTRLWMTALIVGVLVLMSGAAGALDEPAAPEASVAGKINYQGRLTDLDGVPLDGTFPMRFEIYDASAGGSLLWDSGVLNVDVDDGLFNVELGIDPAHFDGQGLWMRIYVDGEWLSPRQELLPTPYALSLRPGAEISGEPTDWTGWVLKANMEGAYPVANALLGSTATGTAVRGESAGGYGLQAYSSSNYGLWSHSDNGTGGQISSSEGYGLRVSSDGGDHWDHAGIFSAYMGYGLYATSDENMAVLGEAGDVSGGYWRPGGQVGVVGIGEDRGVFGSSRDREGVYGISVNDSGVYGETESDDYANDAGVLGAKWSGNGAAVRGLKYGDAGIAVYGTNWGATGSGVVGDSTDYIGVFGESDTYRGVHGVTNRADNNYGLYTPDNLYSLNYNLRGAILHVVQNGGDEALEPGDVVVFAGMAAPLAEGDPPVVQVARAGAAHSTAIAGVVFSRFTIEAVTGAEEGPAGENSKAGLEVTPEGPVPAGEHLLLVVQGPALVKASALAGPLRPGDLLSSADEAGYAAKAAEVQIEGVALTPPGTVLGKALEALDAERGLIYVFVTLQ